MTPTAPTWDALRVLVAKWQEYANKADDEGRTDYAVATSGCAADLEAVLSAALASASAGQEKSQNEQAWDDLRADGGLPESHAPDPEVPRRADMRRWCAAEKAIYEACLAVEQMPAGMQLTNAVVALGKARDHVADYVDGVAPPRAPETPSQPQDWNNKALWATGAPETPQTCETWTKEAVRDEFLKLASWIKTPGNISRDDAIDEIARVLTNCALQVMMGAPPPPSESPT